MKKGISVIILFFVLLQLLESKTYVNRYGTKRNTDTKTQKQLTSSSKSKNQLIAELGMGIEYYRYKEPKVMQIQGPMLNFNGMIGVVRSLFRFQSDLYFATHVGANIYDGSLHNNITQTTTKYSAQSTDYYTGITTKLGINLFSDGKELFFVYTGLGYRFLYNLVIDKPGIQASYGRYQGYLFLPIGLSGEIPLTQKVSFIGMIEQRLLLYGHNTSAFSDLGYDSDLYFTQKRGYGGRIALGSKIYLPSANAIKLNLYFDYWSIEESTTDTAYHNGAFIGNFIEPKNNTIAVGFNITYAF
ncbi:MULTISPECIES: hypothetical protein [unclassified Helicobacter]|uniref:hypothetical protein n=1 Tax=unclassified Helicobacter TaxID=2593540 RepID=UPI000CF17913|nr:MULTISPECIES: hypothetical protein [unclassified Helicobacter]